MASRIYCAVFGCMNSSITHPEITFFRLPGNSESFICIIICCTGLATRQSRKFPDDFVFGVATASYQIEGAWDEDGKGENIWDHITHNQPGAILNQGNGDIAADSYHNYKRDVQMMKELGIHMYRFSVSWSRILPTGFANYVNPAGVEYYNNYIDEMLYYGIKPMITLYHWDLPQALQDLGGFGNPLIAEWFEDFARVVFLNFGDRVKHFLTMNEPREICYQGYASTTKAPALNMSDVGEFTCVKNLVMAHAHAYHVYNNEFKQTQQGECGITMSVSAYKPLTDSAEDAFATEIAKQTMWAIYSYPIYTKQGGFPVEYSEILALKSAKEGYSQSFLPELTEEEIAFVRGTSDFFGMNHYKGNLVAGENLDLKDISLLEIEYVTLEEWLISASEWLTTAYTYDALRDLRSRYGDIKIYITENGWSTFGGLEDDERVLYYRKAWESVLDALEEGINVQGYMAWSLMDNFEWMKGYVERFGLYEVDFEDPARTRTPRKSAFVYKHLVKSRYIDYDYEPSNEVMTIE